MFGHCLKIQNETVNSENEISSLLTDSYDW